MKRQISFFSFLFALSLLHNSTYAITKDKLAKIVSKDVAIVTSSFKSRDPAIYILEENHALIDGQIEHAIMILRLVEQLDIKDIGVEGYLKGDKAHYPVVNKKDNKHRIQFLADEIVKGNIGGAVLAHLFDTDVKLHPVERKSEYFFPPIKVVRAPFIYMSLVALSRYENQKFPVSDKDKEHLDKLSKEYENSSGLKNKAQKYNQLMKALIQLDPEIGPLYNQMYVSREGASSNIEYKISLAQSLMKYDDIIPGNIKSHMQSYIDFLEARDKSSLTMVSSILDVTEKSKKPGILIIGAGHTEYVQNLLKERKRSYVTFRPLSLTTPRNKSTTEYDKYEYNVYLLKKNGKLNQETDVDGLVGLIRGQKIRPKPILVYPESSEKLYAKDELYSGLHRVIEDLTKLIFDDKVTRDASTLSSSVKDFLSKKPEDEYSGKYVDIEARNITLRFHKSSKKPVIIVPVSLPRKGADRKKVWFKIVMDKPLKPEKHSALKTLEQELVLRLRNQRSTKQKGKKPNRGKRSLSIGKDIKALMHETPDSALAQTTSEL